MAAPAAVPGFGYRVDWHPGTLSWRLSYGGQVWATVCAFLPGRPPIVESDALVWADGLVGSQSWQSDGCGHQAVPAAVTR